MKKDVIEKLLNGQATPEEEHLIAQRLQEEEDMERWLIEDETEVYDRIVGQRSAKRSYIRWAVAACFALLMAAGAVMLWPREQASDAIAEQKPAEVTTPVVSDAEPAVAIVTPAKSASTTKRHKRHLRKRTAANTTDSLQFYIARLEKELENVNESTYTTKAEEVLRADARLQKLVQRIMMGELTKANMPSEALNNNNTTEEQP